MTRFSVISAVAVLTMLGGCAYDDYAYRGNAEVALGAPIYYDDYYGPYYDGYWGPDGFFYFSEAAGNPFRRDEGGHFRREGTQGFHAVQGGAMGTPRRRG